MATEYKFQDEIDEILPGVIADRRWLHEHPELGFEETETAEFVRQRLESLGVEDIRTGIAVTGITGLIRGTKPGPDLCVLFRADMDALPIEEENDVEYKSQSPGVMHACGHDGHTSMALGLARLLVDHRDQFSGTVKLLFQPSEEQGTGGAKPMIEQGVLENPHVDYVFGIHLAAAKPTGQILVAGGPVSAAADSFTVTVRGKGGHGAYPHTSIDPLLASVQIIAALQTIVSRNTDPMKQLVVSVCNFHSGHAGNVIPDTATFGGTIRTFGPEVRDMAEDRIRAVIERVSAAMGTTVEINYTRGYPPTVNNSEMAEVVRTATEEAIGADNVYVKEPGMGAEDFSYFLEARPGTFWNVGCRNGERGIIWPHHHPRFDIDEESFGWGLSSIFNTLLTVLNADDDPVERTHG